MTILEGIQEANTAAQIQTLSFATLQEFNSFMDSFTFDKYPVNVVVPIVVRSTFKNNRVKDVFALQGWVLTRIPEDTNNFRSPAMEENYLAPMRNKARKFIRALLNTDMIDPEVEDVAASFTPEYMFLAAHLFGVSYDASIPINSQVCV